MARPDTQDGASSLNFVNEKGFRQIRDEDGTFICNAIECNGRLHTVFGGNMADRLESYRKYFPVFNDDICLVTYPKSGKVFNSVSILIFQ